jgi:Family of unknown function (DUF5522)
MPNPPANPGEENGPAPGESAQNSTARLAPELSPEDFYYEGPFLVFTAAYHLKRGYCCNSDCRHCPYR